MKVGSISREHDDVLAEVRISIGYPRDLDLFYIVFRGDPEKVVALLEDALTAAKDALPKGKYDDKRIEKIG